MFYDFIITGEEVNVVVVVVLLALVAKEGDKTDVVSGFINKEAG